MKIYIDQSGKVEQTQKDTVLACVSYMGKSKQFRSVKISARTKRRLQDIFRQVGRPRDFVIYVFSAACYLLFKPDLIHEPDVIIDIEYPGQEKNIIKIINALCADKKIPDPMVSFSLLGKLSEAHDRAIKTLHKQYKTDLILSFETIYKECFSTKNGRPALKYQVAMTSGKSAPLRPNL
ncbi:MAG: hypothetical protein WC773_01735 [Patescibacteria group bacterium]|jgi:hypothetical protein